MSGGITQHKYLDAYGLQLISGYISDYCKDKANDMVVNNLSNTDVLTSVDSKTVLTLLETINDLIDDLVDDVHDANNVIKSFTFIPREYVNTLPATGKPNTFYVVPNASVNELWAWLYVPANTTRYEISGENLVSPLETDGTTAVIDGEGSLTITCPYDNITFSLSGPNLMLNYDPESIINDEYVDGSYQWVKITC